MTDRSLRQSIAAVALICRCQGDRVLWLARWNRGWNCFHFVGGHKKDNETFRQCLHREFQEELGLDEGRDFTMAQAPRATMKFEGWSQNSQSQTAYTMAVFDVSLLNSPAVAKLNGDDRVRWLALEEIRKGLCGDGRPVSPTMGRLLSQCGCVT